MTNQERYEKIEAELAKIHGLNPPKRLRLPLARLHWLLADGLTENAELLGIDPIVQPASGGGTKPPRPSQ